MQKHFKVCLRIIVATVAAVAMLTTAWIAWSLDGTSAARLKKAGVSNRTLERLIQERTLETGAFTVDEIVSMKAAGIGEETLQTLISAGSFMKDRGPVVYGDHLRSIRLSSAQDLITLKKAGLSDEVLRAIVELNRPCAEADRERALRMLNQLGIWVEQPR